MHASSMYGPVVSSTTVYTFKNFLGERPNRQQILCMVHMRKPVQVLFLQYRLVQLRLTT